MVNKFTCKNLQVGGSRARFFCSPQLCKSWFSGKFRLLTAFLGFSRVPANEEMRNLLHLDYDWMCDFFLEFVGLAEYRRYSLGHVKKILLKTAPKGLELRTKSCNLQNYLNAAGTGSMNSF